MIPRVGRFHFSESFDLIFESQVVAGIGEIKALVAQRKVRDAVFAHREGEAVPVVKGGVFDFYLRNPAVGVGAKDVGDFAAMTLGEGDGERVFGQLLW
jgi:hypothetical protein